MKKFGFTLAEVLITLGIIGVVAALTAPALVSSSRNQANAARLSVLVSNLENATHNMIIQEDVEDIYHTRFGQAGTLDARAGQLGRYMNTNGRFSGTFAEFYPNGVYGLAADGSKGAQLRNGGAMAKANQAIINLKNGATLFISPGGGVAADETEAAKETAANAGCTLVSDAFDVFIDVNGTDEPNVIGRDIFSFYMGANGTLYPMGGADVSRLDGGNLMWNEDGNDYSCVDGAITVGWGCTARIIAEGYKINY